jgi:hypothetical protein
MFSSDLLLDLILGSDVLVLAGVLTILVRVFKQPAIQKLEGQVLGSIEQFEDGVDIIENIYVQAKEKYELFSSKMVQYKAGAADGVSMADAEVVASDLQSLMESLKLLRIKS